MKKIFKRVVVVLLIANSNISFSQFSASIYQGGLDTKLGLGYQFNEKFWVDGRLYLPATTQNFTPELNFNYNFIRKQHYSTYLGVSAIIFDLGGAYGVPIGVSIRPFELKNLSIIMESSLLLSRQAEDEILILGFLGLRYLFD